MFCKKSIEFNGNTSDIYIYYKNIHYNIIIAYFLRSIQSNRESQTTNTPASEVDFLDSLFNVSIYLLTKGDNQKVACTL